MLTKEVCVIYPFPLVCQVLDSAEKSGINTTDNASILWCACFAQSIFVSNLQPCKPL